MCGPIALALPIGKWNNAKKIFGILLYNGGRVLTYALVGLLFGSIGRGVCMVGLQQWVSIALGISIIAIVLLPGRITSRLDAITQQMPYISPVKKASPASLNKEHYRHWRS
jgi:sulfite exporter TauE/SafE